MEELPMVSFMRGLRAVLTVGGTFFWMGSITYIESLPGGLPVGVFIHFVFWVVVIFLFGQYYSWVDKRWPAPPERASKHPARDTVGGMDAYGDIGDSGGE